MVAAGHARRDVREDQIVPAVVRDEPIARGEIDAQLPLGFADLRLHIGHDAMLPQPLAALHRRCRLLACSHRTPSCSFRRVTSPRERRRTRLEPARRPRFISETVDHAVLQSRVDPTASVVITSSLAMATTESSARLVLGARDACREENQRRFNRRSMEEDQAARPRWWAAAFEQARLVRVVTLVPTPRRPSCRRMHRGRVFGSSLTAPLAARDGARARRGRARVPRRRREEDRIRNPCDGPQRRVMRSTAARRVFCAWSENQVSSQVSRSGSRRRSHAVSVGARRARLICA